MYRCIGLSAAIGVRNIGHLKLVADIPQRQLFLTITLTRPQTFIFTTVAKRCAVLNRKKHTVSDVTPVIFYVLNAESGR